MTYFAIRHKPSGAFFPMLRGGMRRGATHINLPFKGTPRLFTKKGAASNCLKWWLGGSAKPIYDIPDEWGNSSGGIIGAIPGIGDPLRVADDMEIIEVEIIEVGTFS